MCLALGGIDSAGWRAVRQGRRPWFRFGVGDTTQPTGIPNVTGTRTLAVPLSQYAFMRLSGNIRWSNAEFRMLSIQPNGNSAGHFSWWSLAAISPSRPSTRCFRNCTSATQRARNTGSSSVPFRVRPEIHPASVRRYRTSFRIRLRATRPFS